MRNIIYLTMVVMVINPLSSHAVPACPGATSRIQSDPGLADLTSIQHNTEFISGQKYGEIAPVHYPLAIPKSKIAQYKCGINGVVARNAYGVGVFRYLQLLSGVVKLRDEIDALRTSKTRYTSLLKIGEMSKDDQGQAAVIQDEIDGLECLMTVLRANLHSVEKLLGQSDSETRFPTKPGDYEIVPAHSCQ